MLKHLGVRGHLLLAFVGISAFAVLAAGAGVYSFLAIGKFLERITAQRVPAAVASLELSRQTERIVAAAPTLLAASSEDDHRELSTTIAREAHELGQLLEQLKNTGVEPTAVFIIEPTVRQLEDNLASLDIVIAQKLKASQYKRELLDGLAQTNIALQRELTPQLLVLDSKAAQLDRAVAEGADHSALRELGSDLLARLPLQKILLEVSNLNDALLQTAVESRPAQLPVMKFPLKRSLQDIDAAFQELTPDYWHSLSESMTELHNFVEGPRSILEARRKELNLIAEGQRLLDENSELSQHLTTAMDGLAFNANKDIRDANNEALAVQNTSTRFLLAVVVLSLVSSVLIVWLYVERNLIRRITALSNSMLAIAGGNLKTDLPTTGNDEIGRMGGALAVFRDTAVEVEESNLREIQETRRLLTDAIESFSDGFCLYDADDKVVLSNSRFLEMIFPGIEDVARPGASFEDMLRTCTNRGLVQLDGRDPEQWVQERLHQHRNPPCSHLQRRTNGLWIQGDERRTEDGGIVAVYSDVTALKQREMALADAVAAKDNTLQALSAAKEQAEQASLVKSQFLANMSHELRTPLNAVIGITEMLHEDAEDSGDSDSIEPLERVSRAGRHLLHLINEILDLSKIEAGRLELQLEYTDVAAIIDDAAETSRALAEQNGNRLIIECEPDAGVMRTDLVRMRQVILNLLSNAAKFTEQGAITLSARREPGEHGDWVVISVADTGIGIAPEYLDDLFQEFSQADGSTTRQYGGTGLGLAISQRLCRLMGGAITVNSTLGEGTTFSVRMPTEFASRDPVPEPQPAAAHS